MKVTLALPAPVGDPSLIGSDLGFVLQSESDLIESLEQASATEVVDLKACSEALVVADCLIQQRDVQVVAWCLLRAIQQDTDFLLRKSHQKQSIIACVRCKDIIEGGRDDDAKTVIR